MGACYSHQQEKNLIVFEGREVCECISQWNQSKNSSAKGAVPQEYHFRVKDQVFKIDSELNSQPNHPDWQGFLISDVSTPLTLEMWILLTTDQSIQAIQEKRIRSIEKLQHNNILNYYYHMKSSFKLVVFRETINSQQINSTNNTIPASLSGYISSNKSKISSNDCFELCDDLAKGLLFMQENIKQNQPQPVQGNTSIKTTSIPQAAIITVSDLFVIQHTLKIDAFFADSKETSINANSAVENQPSSSTSSSTDILRLLTIRLLLNLPTVENTDFNDIYQFITNKGKITKNSSKNTPISLGFLKTAPLQLKEFISWNINPIRTLRPNIQEIEKELDILRKDAQVVQYINQLYLGNNQISVQDEIQEDQGQQSLHLPRQRQSYSLVNSSISSQMLPPTSVTAAPLLSVHNPSTAAGVLRKQAGYNPEELLKTKFQFFEETYEIASYLGATQYSILFRVDNIKKQQQKSLMLRLSKQAINEDPLHSSQQYPVSHPYNNTIEEEYNILKQFHCKSIIRVYSLLMIRQQFPGIIMSLPNTDLREYLISSQKLNIAQSLLDYLESMISGVHELHVRSIVHNNLSFKAVCLVNKVAVLTNLEYARAPHRLEKEVNDGNQGILKEINGENMNESNGLGAGNVSSSQQLLLKSSNPFNSVINSSNPIVAKQVSLKASKATTHSITKLQTLTGNNQGNNPNNVLPFVNEYSAPEVRDQIYCDYASDVYSLGLLVLSSLCNVSQEKLRRVTEAAYNPLPITSDHYTSHIGRNINDNRGSSMLQSSVGFMQQSTLTSSLRDILGQKCPVEIINGFESMIAKNPEDRGQCSDYLPKFEQLKSLPHVIEYINVQNKLARFI